MEHLILTDSVTPVPDGYFPKLKKVGTALLEERAAESCLKMLSAAQDCGVMIKLLSGYRSAEYQRTLLKQSVMQRISEGMTPDEAEKLTERSLAKPFHSEHQLGLACDFCSPDWDDVQDDFSFTRQGGWLKENAADYGFILRYPRMKEHITGISYEPWHYRFVGLPHSVIIRREVLTLEEYLYYYELKEIFS